MREWCNCGSGIRTVSPRRINAWRAEHKHAVSEPDEPEMGGSHAVVELAGDRYFEHVSSSHDVPIVQARLGFGPNR
jgi:hypothetical protein